MSRRDRFFVLGLDGACWKFLDPWIDAGDLPAFARLKREGVFGTLQSCLPPVSCPAWRCFSTGKNPGKLGVYWWVDFDPASGQSLMPDSRSFRSADIWDYIGDSGRQVLVVNMSTSYPPKPVNGWMVSGPGDAPYDWSAPYTSPASLQPELEKKFGYCCTWPLEMTFGKDPDTQYKEFMLKGVHHFTDMRLRFVEDELGNERWDFIHLALIYINQIHPGWCGQEPLRTWRRVDGFLRRVLDGGWNVVVMSDHGSMTPKHSVNLAGWLMGKGLLKADTRGVQARWDTSKFFENRLDWKNSAATALPLGALYVNPQAPGRQRLVGALARELSELRFPGAGERIIRQVVRKEDAFTGPSLAKAPDLVAVAHEQFELSAVYLPQVFYEDRRFSIGNIPEGLWGACGPAFAPKGAIQERMSLWDLAPTILHAMGLSVPGDMDGRALMDALSVDRRRAFPAAKRREPLLS